MGEPHTISDLRRWTIVGLQFAASFLNYLHRVTLPMALPVIAAELALGPERKGVLLSAFFWSYTAMQIPIGWCCDRLSLRWLYPAMLALWSLACGLTGFARGFAAILLLRVAMGVGESVYLPAGTKVVSLLFPAKDAGLPIGIFNSGTRWGVTLGTPLAAWLIARHGWHNMFFIVSSLGLLWLLPWWLVYAPSAVTVRRPTGSEASAAVRRPRVLTFDRNLLGICLGFFCWDYYWYLLFNWLPDYLVEVRHFTILKAGIYAAFPFLVFALAMPLGGGLADWLIRRGWDETRTRKMIVTVTFLAGLLLIPAVRVEDGRTAVWLLAAASLVGAASPNILAMVQCCAAQGQVGAWTGAENFTGNIGGILAPLVTGFLIARTGSYRPGFILAAVILMAGLASYWFVVGELKPLRRDDL